MLFYKKKPFWSPQKYDETEKLDYSEEDSMLISYEEQIKKIEKNKNITKLNKQIQINEIKDFCKNVDELKKKKKINYLDKLKQQIKETKIFYSYVWQNFEEPSIYELYSRITNDYWDGDKTLKNLKKLYQIKDSYHTSDFDIELSVTNGLNMKHHLSTYRFKDKRPKRHDHLFNYPIKQWI